MELRPKITHSQYLISSSDCLSNLTSYFEMNGEVCPSMNFRSEHLSEKGHWGTHPRPLKSYQGTAIHTAKDYSCLPHTGHSACELLYQKQQWLPLIIPFWLFNVLLSTNTSEIVLQHQHFVSNLETYTIKSWLADNRQSNLLGLWVISCQLGFTIYNILGSYSLASEREAHFHGWNQTQVYSYPHLSLMMLAWFYFPLSLHV